jgi:alpha-N-acetylglucosamine transferase
VFTKLRAFELVEFDRVVLLAGPAISVRKVLKRNTKCRPSAASPQ